MEADINKIVWPEYTQESRKQNCKTIKALCRLGEVTEWLQNNAFKSMPYRYKVNNLRIEFLPDWATINISKFVFKAPKSIDDLNKMIEAVETFLKSVKDFGYKQD